MRSDIINIAIDQIFKARLHFGKKIGLLHETMIFHSQGNRHGITIFNLEKILYHLRIIFAAIVEITSRRGVFFLLGGSNSELLESLLFKIFHNYNKKNNIIAINTIVPTLWTNGLFSNWQIVYKHIQYIKKFKAKNTTQKASIVNLQKIEYLHNYIIPDVIFMFNYNKDAVVEADNFNIPIISIADGSFNYEKFLYSFLGNSDNITSIYFFCQLFNDATKVGQLEEQEKFLYYFILRLKNNLAEYNND